MDLRTKAEMGQQQKGKRQSPKFFGPFCVIFSLHFFLCLLFISLSRIPSGFRLTWQVIRSHSFLCCMRTRKLYEVHILQGFFPPSGGSPSQPGSQLGTCDSKLGAFLTAWHCTVRRNQVLQQTWGTRLPLGMQTLRTQDDSQKSNPSHACFCVFCSF